MTDDYMVINGVRYPVTSAWVELGPTSDGRRRWGVATQKGAEVQPEPQPAAPAGATVINCMQRGDVHEPHEWAVRDHTYWCKGDSAQDYVKRPAPLFRQSGPAVPPPFQG